MKKINITKQKKPSFKSGLTWILGIVALLFLTQSVTAQQSFDFESGDQGWVAGQNATTTCGLNTGGNNNWTLATQTGGFAPIVLGTQWYGVPNNGGVNQGIGGAESSWIESPAMTANAATVTINFDSYSSNEGGYPTTFDVEHVQISVNAGPFTDLHAFDAQLHGFGMQTFQNITYNAAVASGDVVAYRFHFDTCDGCCGPTNIIGWFLDNVMVSGVEAPGGGGGGAGVVCDLECPESVIVATTDPGSDCSAYVTIPQPLTNGGCDLSTLTNDWNGGTDASGEFPLGTTDVEYCIIDLATGNQICCTVQIIVVDLTPPTFNGCPGDMTVNLDAGECEAVLTFDLSADEECFVNAVSYTTNNDVNGAITNSVGCPGGGYQTLLVYDLPSMGVTQDLAIESVDFGVFQIFGSVGLTVNVYSIDAVPGANFTYGDLTLLASGTQAHGPSGNGIENMPIAGIIPAGTIIVLELIAPNGTFVNGFVPGYNTNGLNSTPDYTYLSSIFCQEPEPIEVSLALGQPVGNFGWDMIFELHATFLDASIPVDADPGNPFANGDALPIGEHCFLYTSEDQAGNVSSCEFCVTVQEYPNPSQSLTCNDQVNISLDQDCGACVGADDILEGGNYGCYDDYEVHIFTDAGLTNEIPTSPCLTSQNIGQTLWVQVIDPENPQNNSCWGTIFVEDKIIPALECVDATLRCNDPLYPGYTFGIPGGVSSASITDGGSWTSTGLFDNTFPISGVGTVTDVNVSLDITHTWVGDLTISVTSPDGTSVNVLQAQCGNTDNMDLVFDDESANGFACPMPTNGSDLQPQNALSGLDGVLAEGDWIVTVNDPVGGDGGNINAITLEVTYSGETFSNPFPLPADATVVSGNNPYTVIGFDPCSSVTLSYVDAEEDGDCVDDDFITLITRTWTAVDASGNETTCDQIITVERQTIEDVVFPENLDGLENPYMVCEMFNTHPDNTGYPQVNGKDIASGGVCEFGVDWEDQIIPICEGTFKIIRTWTVLAWCPTTEIATDIQIIKVVDDNGPDVVCADNQEISTGQNDCLASAIIQYPTVSDACSSTTSLISVSVSSGTLNADATAVYGLPIGTHTVSFTYADACGNENSCSYTITVSDEVPPVAICESFHTVGLTIDEPTLVAALVFDDGSYDNCNLVEYLVRRMDNPNCPGNDATPFAAHVPFYCCDVGGPNVMVELRVRDEAGNTNSCMVEVEVQDKLNPAILCPPDKILDCYEDPYDLDLTGYATASDNCSFVITHIDQGGLDNCGEGTIFRVWTATDPGGRTATCVQRIDVINSDPFDADTDVSWPNDYNTNTCGPGLDPDVTGEPVINEDGCDLVGVTYEDVDLPITPPACLKILRTWKVYDWCTFDANNFDPNDPTASEGYWEYTQIIKVLNSEAPEITSDCENLAFCSFDPNCATGPVTLTLEATDDCTDDAELNYYYWIDLGNDGDSDIHSTGSSVSGNYPLGTHSILWHVEDGCGNVSMCEYLFVVADCKKPTPNLLNGIATEMMEDCQIEIWATDFDNPSSPSFDNCGIQEWRIVSPSQGPGQTAPPAGSTDNHTFSGSGDLGTNSVDIWILDVNGNWAYVSTYILVQDNLAPFCTGSSSASISGSIENEEADYVEDVMVDIDGNAPGVPDPAVTGAGGAYGFPGLANGGNYVITPEKDDNPLNGVTTFDLVLISKHILGISDLGSPYKMIAADINNSGSISTIDMVELRKLILFIDTEFQNNTSWRFVESDFVFPDATNPFASAFPEEFSVNGLSTAEIADFIAVKTGDVNGSAQANGFSGSSDDRNANGDLVFAIEDLKMVAGETYTVDFKANDFTEILGYQFSIAFDENAIDVVDVDGKLSGLTADNFGMNFISEGVITTSWNNSTAVSLDDNEVVFSLTFVANTNAQLSEVLSTNSRYTKAEGYDNNLNLLDIGLSFNGNTVVGGEFDLYQNQPNPFKSETVIGFNLPVAGNATLTIFDVSGKVLKVYSSDFAQGYNEVEISRAELSGAGVLYYQLDTENDSATKKMILID